jgi:hypothetical protein
MRHCLTRPTESGEVMARTTDTTTRNSADELRAEFDRLKATASFDAEVPVGLAQALDRLLTALEYEDETLRRSAAVDARTALAEMIDEDIDKRLVFSRNLCEGAAQAGSIVGVLPSNEFDEGGRLIESHLNGWLRVLTNLRDGTVRTVVSHGVELTRAGELDDEIARVEAFKAAFIGGWPWSHLPAPTPDPDSAARSRAEAERGEFIGADDFLAELEGGGR